MYMKVIFSFFGIFIGPLILSIYFKDISIFTNVFIDIIGGIITVSSTVIIAEWLKKTFNKEPPNKLL